MPSPAFAMLTHRTTSILSNNGRTTSDVKLSDLALDKARCGREALAAAIAIWASSAYSSRSEDFDECSDEC